MGVKITIFKTIFDKKAHHIDVIDALERIKNGASGAMVTSIRSELDKEKRNDLKSKLPAICFSGVFDERKDESLKNHSGLMVLDFDDVSEMDDMFERLKAWKHTFAVWVSPSGNGLKCLVKINQTPLVSLNL